MNDIQAKQPKIYNFLKKTIEKEKIVHAYLFEGESGTGKKELATWLAQCVFCEEASLACQNCHNCQRILAENHPDVHHLSPDGQSIKIDQVLEIKKHLGKSGLENRRQFLIVEKADKMTVQSANSLLKFIEEPTGILQIVFLTENKGRVLPTIQSRCQNLFFESIPTEAFERQLIGQNVSQSNAKLIAQLTNNLKKGLELSEDEWFNEIKDVVEKWLQYLIKKDYYAFIYVQQYIIKRNQDKQQQEVIFNMLLAYFHLLLKEQLDNKYSNQDSWSKIQLAQSIEEILLCKNKWLQNVAFQATLEQLTLKIIAK